MRCRRTWIRVSAAVRMPETARSNANGTSAVLDDNRRTPRPSSLSMDYGELQDRFDTFVMLVEARLGELGFFVRAKD